MRIDKKIRKKRVRTQFLKSALKISDGFTVCKRKGTFIKARNPYKLLPPFIYAEKVLKRYGINLNIYRGDR